MPDGARQQRAAIKIYATMAKDVVEQAGVAEATQLLDHIRAFTDEALQAWREAARGITRRCSLPTVSPQL